MNNTLDENDLRLIFTPEAPESQMPKLKIPAKLKSSLPAYLQFLGIFVLIFALTYTAVNFSALFKKLNYFWNVNLQKDVYSQSIPTPSPTSFIPSSEARLVVPKLGIDALIIWNVEEQDISKELINGVVHSKGTALPGEVGNVFIIGHSSYYSWVQSDYKAVFALLDKLAPGDKIYIKYNTALLTYDIEDSKVVSPNQLDVMAQPPGYTLTLMTCVPVGTNLNRLVVTAKQIMTP